LRIELSRDAVKELKKIDAAVRKRILDFLEDRVGRLEDPRAIGEPLKGPVFGELWKYRFGDYRILCKIEDMRLVVLVVRIGHRKDVYRDQG
jgi:mRNA interferase RelE/StbE